MDKALSVFILVLMVGWLSGYLLGRVGRFRWETDAARKVESDAKRKELEARLLFAVEMRKLAALSGPLQISLDTVGTTAKHLTDLRQEIEREHARTLARPQEVTRWTDL